MGLKQSSYVIGWLVSTYLRGIIVSLIFLIPCIIFNAFKGIPIPELIGFYLLYFFASLHQCYMFSTLFDSAKTGADVTTIIQSLASCLYFLNFVEYVNENSWVICLLSLFPQACIQFTFMS